MIKLTIPRLPPSPNGKGGYLRMHWAKRRKDKEEWKWEIVAQLLLEPGMAPVDPWVLVRTAPRCKVKVRIHQVRARKLDRDNLWASVKNIVDAIVICGLARGDSEKWMDLSVSQETGKPHRTEITIE